LVLGNSASTAWLASRVVSGPRHLSEADRIIQYVATLGLEFFLFFLVWVGLRLNGTKLRGLIGGRWDSVEAFLLDVALAFAFSICAFIMIGGLGYALGLSKTSQVDQAKKLAGMLAPHTWRALLIFVVLSSVAGFVEEIIFRGYLQRQLTELSGKTYVGLILSALIFGASHGYEGARRMLLISILGLMFGLLVLWRNNLRSAMMGHALFDSAQGIILFVATRIGFLS
jgi:membrane protease YdiL (CAAX protease family)